MKNEHLDSRVSNVDASDFASSNASEIGGSSPAVQLLRRSLERFFAKDMKGWAELCDADVVAEFPFAPDKASRTIIGRTGIYEYLRNYPNIIDAGEPVTMNIYGTDNPDLAVAEWSVSGRVIATGNPYEMSYATFVTVKNGLIVNYREYWDPCAFTTAMEGTMF